VNLQWVKRELIGSRTMSVLYLLNLAVGLVGFAMLSAFKSSFQNAMAVNSRNLMNGDIEISARRLLTDDELKQSKNFLASDAVGATHVLTLYSMVSGAQGSRLAEIKGIESLHPLYGSIILKNSGKISSETAKDIFAPTPTVWIYPELQGQLGVKVGDSITIGNSKFRVSDLILDDSGLNWVGASLAPRVYISYESLNNTGLVRTGSTLWNSVLFKLKEGADANAAATRLNQQFSDPAVAAKSHENSSEQTGQLLRYANDYLGLVAISGLFLAAIGGSFLYRSYLLKKTREVAIFVSLGATHGQAILSYFLATSAAGVLAAVLALAGAAAAFPILPMLLKNFLPLTFGVSLDWETALTVLMLGMVTSTLTAIPMLLRLREVKAKALFDEGVVPTFAMRARDALLYFPAVFVGWALAVWQSHSLFVGSLFVGVFFLSAVVLGISGTLLLLALSRAVGKGSFSRRWAMKNITRHRFSAMTAFIALGLGSLLVNLIPQLKANLSEEFTVPGKTSLPSLFLFDIQDDALTGIQQIASSQGAPIIQSSPMVRARLMKRNGEEWIRTDQAGEYATREAARSAEQRNRSFNLSYRDGLSESESIVVGDAIQGAFKGGVDQHPKLSLEYRFADRLGLKLGDILTFDVQGVQLSGIVANFRKVKWASFQPNFFVQFQPGVLEAAPKTFVTSIGPLPQDRKESLQDAIVRAHPNVSVVDVSRVVRKILDIVSTLSLVLTYMAWLTIGAGFVILFSIAQYQAKARERDTALLKVLGASFSSIHSANMIEFGLISIFASVFGAALALLGSWVLSAALFQGMPEIGLAGPVLRTLVVALMAVIVSILATNRALRVKPAILLN
jgi:putative ABC transport system permease protein